MLVKHFILIFLPVVVYGRINIKIKVAKTASKASVNIDGQNIAIINEQDREAFQLDDESLKKASKIFAGKRCTDVFLKRPTPWEDVYRKFGWQEIKVTLRPVQARVIGVNAKPVSVGSAEYVNTHPRINGTYSTSVTQVVEESISHTWMKGGELNVAQEISYSLNFGAGNIGSTTTLSYTSTWGQDDSKSRSVTLGATSSVEVPLPPGGRALATLIATQGTMDIEVDYEATVDGRVFCNYHGRYRGHHWWAYPINLLQASGKLPGTVRSTEIISVGFYTSARIEVSDLDSHAPITQIPAGIIKMND